MVDAKNPFTTRHVSAPECAGCHITGVTVQLHPCRICHKRFCDDCAFHSRTGLFCSDRCAQIFFQGEGEEEEEEADELDDDSADD